MTRLGGTTKRYYWETRGIKVSGGQRVKTGTILTREGHRWHPGVNVLGRTNLTAACEGVVYFTKKRGNYRRAITIINIKPAGKKEIKKKTDSQ